MAGTRVLEPRDRAVPGRASEAEAVPVVLVRRPSYFAFQLLRIGFVIVPLLAGVDKFTHLLTNWDTYLAASVEKRLPLSGHNFMLVVGVVEIIAAILVAVVPWIGAWVVAGWLLGIIVNLLLIPGFYDVAFRDLGLIFGAVALGILAWEFGRSRKIGPPEKVESSPGV
jgi:hypothetical protein